MCVSVCERMQCVCPCMILCVSVSVRVSVRVSVCLCKGVCVCLCYYNQRVCVYEYRGVCMSLWRGTAVSFLISGRLQFHQFVLVESVCEEQPILLILHHDIFNVYKVLGVQQLHCCFGEVHVELHVAFVFVEHPWSHVHEPGGK